MISGISSWSSSWMTRLCSRQLTTTTAIMSDPYLQRRIREALHIGERLLLIPMKTALILAIRDTPASTKHSKRMTRFLRRVQRLEEVSVRNLQNRACLVAIAQ